MIYIKCVKDGSSFFILRPNNDSDFRNDQADSVDLDQTAPSGSSLFAYLCLHLFSGHITVNFLNIQTPKKFVVITLKFELRGSTIE